MMFVERSWGIYKVLDIESENILKKIVLYSGKSIDLHCYKYKMWVVIEGDGNILHDGIEQKIRTGDVLTINADNKYTVIANTKLELIEVQLRENLPEDGK
jgi:mannose-1-phosphate guanylyltransferase